MRYPAVSGSFYPSSPTALSRQVNELLAKAREEMAAGEPEGRAAKKAREEMPAREKGGAKKAREIKAMVCPHAGYEYSGLTAACSFAAAQKQLQKKNTTVIILGPNHTGAGQLVSVSFDDWSTPVGKSETDLPLAGALVRGAANEGGKAGAAGAGNKAGNASILTRNEQAHFREHSIEVQLPFLQTINPAAKIVAICLMAQDGKTSRRVGEAIYRATKRPEFADRNFMVLASSDFTHYQTAKAAEALDQQPLEFICQLDDGEFSDEVEGKNLSICGHGAIAAAMAYAKLAGCKKAELLRYTNSGKETGGNESSVVAYASLILI